MRFGVLGATAAWREDGAVVAAGGPRSRALLALLALDAGHFISPERLIDGMYGESPPDGAANALQSQVSRLRTALKEIAPVEFTPAGYRLAVDQDEVDVHRFTRLAREGRALLTAGEHPQAADVLAEALGLWRGPAFADLDQPPTQVVRLDELRADAAGDHIEARLALGRAEEVLSELHELIAEHPLRERSRAQLVRALNAVGRTADALTAFEDARRILADELGADPGPELAEAHLAVLRGDTERPSIPALPAQLTSFVGRGEELRRISELLSRSRLVTLTGPGGTGKTRLAIETASAEAGPVAFVGLAPHDRTDVAGAVLAALGLRDGPMRGGPQDSVERLIAALKDQAALVVLDNCEHVVDTAAQLAERLLGACPGLRILATSREPLGITGEQLAPVPRLAVPPPGTSAGQALEFPAVRLFADRAAASDPAFAVDETTIGDVQHICAALDGLPLALELAAARVRALPVGDIAVRLDDRFRLLGRGSRTAEERHRSLRGVVEWSWDLLDEDERQLARRLTVFAGGATLTTAAAVCGGDDLLPELADKSLVEAGGGRFRMLETIRAFCAEQLAESGEAEEIHRAHAEFFLHYTEEADSKLLTSEQLGWLDRIDVEYENILAALRWSTLSAPDLAVRLVLVLSTYWWMRGRRFEGAALALEVIRHCPPETQAARSEEFLACVLNAWCGVPDHDVLKPYQSLLAGYNANPAWSPRHPIVIMLHAVAIGPPVDDGYTAQRAEALLGKGGPWIQAMGPTGLGLRSLVTGELDAAESGLREGEKRFRALGERWGLSMCLDHLSQVLVWRGHHDEARVVMTESLGLMEELGATDDRADLICRRAESQVLQGDLAGARADYELAATLARQSGMPEARAAALVGLATVARHSGDLPAARALTERALAECPEGSYAAAGVRAGAYVSLGWIAAAEGRAETATSMYQQALASVSRWQSSTGVASAIEGLAGVAILERRPERAALLLGAAVALRGTALPGDPDVTRTRAMALESLGDDGFERSYGMGLGMSAQKALESVST